MRERAKELRESSLEEKDWSLIVEIIREFKNLQSVKSDVRGGILVNCPSSLIETEKPSVSPNNRRIGARLFVSEG